MGELQTRFNKNISEPFRNFFRSPMNEDIYSFFSNFPDTNAQNQWRPLIDVQTKDDKYIVCADIPGVDPKDINVHIDGNLLTIEGEKKTENVDKGEGYSRTERFVGSFYRQINLPDNIQEDNIVAKCENGVLKLTIPKVEKRKSKKIEVKT